MGWAGLAGIVLLLVSVFVAHRVWRERGDLEAIEKTLATRPPSPLVVASGASAALSPPVKLARRDEVTLLLARAQRAASENGVPWSAADYRLVPATDRQAGSLEIRCTLKGSYPKLRSTIVHTLGISPATTLRELQFSRASLESEEVEARMNVVVYLDDVGTVPSKP